MDPTVYFTRCSQRCFTSSCSQRTADVGRAPSDHHYRHAPRATVLIDGMRAGHPHHRCDPPVTRYGTTSVATDATRFHALTWARCTRHSMGR